MHKLVLSNSNEYCSVYECGPLEISNADGRPAYTLRNKNTFKGSSFVL